MGFHKPHLHWTAPKRYWDLYDRAEIPKIGPIETELAGTLKHACLAGVSGSSLKQPWRDGQFGEELLS